MADPVNLVASTPFAGLFPIKIGSVFVEEVSFASITSLAPFAGKAATVSKALKKQAGVDLPQSGHMAAAKDVRVIWAGKDQFFVLGGPVLEPINGAAMTDQSDAWACAALDGANARDVLTRLVPIDLRDVAFPEGATARTLVGHMSAVLIRSGPARYEIMVFRSMAQTLAHDLKEALETVAAIGR